MREVQFRGWMMDKSGEWATIDKMSYTGNDAKLSHKEWGVSSDGSRFIMRMGGMETRKEDAGQETLTNPSDLPNYLKGSYLDELFEMPATIEAMQAEQVTANSATVAFNITDGGTDPSVDLFYGTDEGLTKEEHWQTKVTVPSQSGINRVVLENLSPATKYYYRVRITNKEGITWMMDTQYLTTQE